MQKFSLSIRLTLLPANHFIPFFFHNFFFISCMLFLSLSLTHTRFLYLFSRDYLYMAVRTKSFTFSAALRFHVFLCYMFFFSFSVCCVYLVFSIFSLLQSLAVHERWHALSIQIDVCMCFVNVK